MLKARGEKCVWHTLLTELAAGRQQEIVATITIEEKIK